MSVVSDSPQRRKARGAFTPDVVARFIAEWAVRDATDEVLEPSCGEAALLHAAHEQLTRLTRPDTRTSAVRLHGVELHAASAQEARRGLAERGAASDIRVADFFTLAPVPRHDGVIGNLPYIRYQDFAGEMSATREN